MTDNFLSRGGPLATVAESYRADQLAATHGVPSLTLMANAAAAVTREIRARWTPRPTLVLAGPGNNGGDGFGVASALAAARWPVRVALLGARDRLNGDAAMFAARWPGPVENLSPVALDGASLVIDALFGAGLDRPVDGAAGAILEALAALTRDVVAIDVPSGVSGDDGRVLGFAAPATLTVTFFRAKPGHFLYPGRRLRGQLAIADIGMPRYVHDAIQPRNWLNGPDLWRAGLPWPEPEGHKYWRGHGLVIGGEQRTGAARLAARAALTAGAGLVTVAAPVAAQPIYATALAAVMVAGFKGRDDVTALLADERKNAVLIGPGAGVGEETRWHTQAALAAGKACVLDADALTSFAGHRRELFGAIRDGCVLTPHDGEFARLFDHDGDRLARARSAAAESGAVIVLKGPDTVIAAPDGRAAINANAPPDLATAGSGDVLSGVILALLAQAMPAFEAACAAVWLQGEAAVRHGPGLTAETLLASLPTALAALKALRSAADGD